MKRIWAGSLSLSLGWFAATGAAQDIIGTTPGMRPPVSLGRPIAVTPNTPSLSPLPAPADPAITPVSYQPQAAPAPLPPPPSPPDGTWFLPQNRPVASSSTPGTFAVDNSRLQRVAYTSQEAIPSPPTEVPGPAGVDMLPNLGPSPIGGEILPHGCDSCVGPSHAGPRFYGSADYLLWWLKDARVPPLVTTSGPASAGILGNPDTVILFGGSHLDSGDFSGGRFTIGWWFDSCHEKAIEFTGFFLGERSVNFGASSDQFPVIARPFFNFNTGSEFSQVTTSPGLSTGRIDVHAPTNLWGTEANLRCNVCSGCGYHVDLLAGFRYLELAESLAVLESINVSPGVPMFGGDQISVLDTFSTHNHFYGGQVGIDAEVDRGHWFADFRGKLALGDTRQVVNIGGGQAITTPAGATTTFQGGLLALPTNIGHFHRDQFGVIPELGINVGYRFNDHWRAFVGYNFLYWSSVVRPGDQIDRVIDVTKIPNFAAGAAVPPAPQARPAVLFRDTEFWAQGINFGLEFRY